MSNLPSRESSIFSSAPSNPSEYADIIQAVHERLSRYTQQGAFDETILILEAFLRHMPIEGRLNVASDILDCDSDEQLKITASSFNTTVLGPMRARGQTPDQITPSGRFNADADYEEIASEFEGVETRNTQAALKKACLRRDGNKSVVSGYYDTMEAMKLTPNEQQGVVKIRTQAAHIIPFSLGNTASHTSAYIWDGLYRCFPRLRSILRFTTANINDTTNAITIDSALHEEFGNFVLTFEATQTEHTYRLKTYPGFSNGLSSLLPSSRLVRFTSLSGHALPSPILLELHATIGKVLHASGLGEVINNVLRERESVGVLAENGSTNIERLLLAF